MRKLVIAAAIALSAPVALGSVAQAATTKVVIKETDRHPHRVMEKRHVMHGNGRNCMTKKVVTRAHGERVVRMTKVCR